MNRGMVIYMEACDAPLVIEAMAVLDLRFYRMIGSCGKIKIQVPTGAPKKHGELLRRLCESREVDVEIRY